MGGCFGSSGIMEGTDFKSEFISRFCTHTSDLAGRAENKTGAATQQHSFLIHMIHMINHCRWSQPEKGSHAGFRVYMYYITLYMNQYYTVSGESRTAVHTCTTSKHARGIAISQLQRFSLTGAQIHGWLCSDQVP